MDPYSGSNQKIPEQESPDLENHVNENVSHGKFPEKDRRKGKPIPGFAREIILKVAAICEEEAKNNFSKYPLNAPTKRAAMYTGVSERTIQRIRNEDRNCNLAGNRQDSANDNKKTVIQVRHPDDESNYNTMKRKSKKGQTIPSSARDVISKVIDSCDREHKEGEYMVPFVCKSKRTALYTGVSQRTVQRIKNEDEKRNKIDEEKVLKTPGRKRKRSTFNDKIDDFDFYSIRRLIDDLISTKNVSPTCTVLHTAVKERINFPYSEDTLYRLLHSKGFEWYKGKKGKKILREKEEIFIGRLEYLQKIKKYEEQGKFLVYLDDKYIGIEKGNSCLGQNGIFGIKGGICCSGRLVVLNEYSVMGFVKRAETLFRPNIVDPEAKPDISIVDKWLKENLFPNIPPNSVLVMSTNPYKQADATMPNEYSSKSTLVEFLKEKNLKYNAWQTCSEMHGIIKNYVAKLPNEWSDIDKIIEYYGHIVLRLPSYMSEFNPIELAWADIKRYIRDKNTPGKMTTKLIKEIVIQAVECFQNSTLQAYVNHVIQLEQYFSDRQLQKPYDLQRNNHIANDSNVLLNTANVVSDNCLDGYTPSMLPHGHLGYVKSVATPIIHASTVICHSEDVEGRMVQPGPSYLNL